MMAMDDVCLLVDLPALLKRRVMAKGGDTSAVEVVKQICDVTERYKFGRTVVCADCPSGKSWRQDLIPDYKAKETASAEYLNQVSVAFDLIRANGLEYLHLSNHCAGDAIASMVSFHPGRCVIATNRVLCRQLIVSGRVTVLIGLTGEHQWITAEILEDPEQGMGIKPAQVVDFFCLVGEPGVAGAKGIGEARARQLLGEFGSCPEMIAAVDTMPPKFANPIREFAERYQGLRDFWSFKRFAFETSHAWQCLIDGDGDERKLVCHCPIHRDVHPVYSALPGEATDRVVSWVSTIIERKGWFDPARDNV